MSDCTLYMQREREKEKEGGNREIVLYVYSLEHLKQTGRLMAVTSTTYFIEDFIVKGGCQMKASRSLGGMQTKAG